MRVFLIAWVLVCGRRYTVDIHSILSAARLGRGLEAGELKPRSRRGLTKGELWQAVLEPHWITVHLDGDSV